VIKLLQSGNTAIRLALTLPLVGKALILQHHRRNNTAVGYQALIRKHAALAAGNSTAITTGVTTRHGLQRFIQQYHRCITLLWGAGHFTANTTASNNTAVGYQAGYSNTKGVTSIAVG
jgi:hypothetical protein